MDDEFIDYEMHVCIEDIRALHYCVSVGIERWAGGDPEEQERLFHIKSQLQAMMFDHAFRNS